MSERSLIYGVPVTSNIGPEARRGRARRAAPLSADDRRKAILDVVVPLIVARGEAVSTREIASAAGIAEGTIFRVFEDKAALFRAAAEQTMSPDADRAQLAAVLEGVDDLPTRVLRTVEHLFARMERTMAVMLALRPLHTTTERGNSHAARGRGRHRDRPPGPPAYVAEANEALLVMLGEVFEPHAHVLAVSPQTAALLLRSLVFGAHHPGMAHRGELTAAVVTDVLLGGIRARDEDGPTCAGAATGAERVDP